MEIQLGTPRFEAQHDPRALRVEALREVAVAFEATFIAEMLKSSGLGESRGEFGGGAGEDGFSSMLVDEQAALLAKHGGIGLSESIFQSLWAKEFGHD